MVERGLKSLSPVSFSPVAFPKVEIKPPNFINFVFISFLTLLWNINAMLSTSPKLLNLNKITPQRNCFFWSDRYITEVMITFVMEMPTSKSHRVTKLWSHDTAQKMKFSIKDFFSKCDQIRSFLRIWSHWLKKSLMENFIFCVEWLYLQYNLSYVIKFRYWHHNQELWR